MGFLFILVIFSQSLHAQTLTIYADPQCQAAASSPLTIQETDADDPFFLSFLSDVEGVLRFESLYDGISQESHTLSPQTCTSLRVLTVSGDDRSEFRQTFSIQIHFDPTNGSRQTYPLEVTIIDDEPGLWKITANGVFLAQAEEGAIIPYLVSLQGSLPQEVDEVSLLIEQRLSASGYDDSEPDDFTQTLAQALAQVPDASLEVRNPYLVQVTVPITEGFQGFFFSLGIEADGVIEPQEGFTLILSQSSQGMIETDRTVGVIFEDGESGLGSVAALVTPLIVQSSIRYFSQEARGQIRRVLARPTGKDWSLWTAWHASESPIRSIQGWQGIDYRFPRDWVVGGVLGYEYQNARMLNDSRLEAFGGGMGIYLGKKLTQTTVIDFGLMWLGLGYDASLTLGAQNSQGQFNAQRLSGFTNITGELTSEESCQVSVRPGFGIEWGQEWQEFYTDTQNRSIPSQEFGFGIVSFGPRLGYPVYCVDHAQVELFLEARGGYAFIQPSLHPPIAPELGQARPPVDYHHITARWGVAGDWNSQLRLSLEGQYFTHWSASDYVLSGSVVLSYRWREAIRFEMSNYLPIGPFTLSVSWAF